MRTVALILFGALALYGSWQCFKRAFMQDLAIKEDLEFLADDGLLDGEEWSVESVHARQTELLISEILMTLAFWMIFATIAYNEKT